MKKFELNVVNFDNEDVIATSGEEFCDVYTAHFYFDGTDENIKGQHIVADANFDYSMDNGLVNKNEDGKKLEYHKDNGGAAGANKNCFDELPTTAGYYHFDATTSQWVICEEQNHFTAE